MPLALEVFEMYGTLCKTSGFEVGPVALFVVHHVGQSCFDAMSLAEPCENVYVILISTTALQSIYNAFAAGQKIWGHVRQVTWPRFDKCNSTCICKRPRNRL